MHADEIPTDSDLVRRLLASQFPDWAGREITPVAERGTDHALYRLRVGRGPELVVRLPIIDWAVGQAESDRRWLPVLAPYLPVTLPVPVAVGEPGEGFPYPWSVVPWIEGATPGPDADQTILADELATFVRSLRQVPPSGGPVKEGLDRGVPLAARDQLTRTAVDALGDRVDREAVLRSWDASLSAAPWSAEPAWLHGDLQPGNLLVDAAGHLTAVIDWGAIGLGDPAADVAPAWKLFDATSRPAYRRGLDVDDDTWLRGRGWALSTSVVALPYYWDTAPDIVAECRATIASVLAD